MCFLYQKRWFWFNMFYFNNKIFYKIIKSMFNHLLGDYSEIPINSQKRKCTDIFCCIFSALFALTIFVFALIYYIQAPNKTSGYFNLPATTNAPGNITSYDYHGFMITLLCATIISLGLGLLWMTIIQLVPLYAPQIVTIISFIGLVVVAVFCFMIKNKVFSQLIWLRYVVAGIVIVMAIVAIAYLFMYSGEMRFQGLLLKMSVKCLNSRPSNYLNIIFFLFLNAAFIALFVFQHLSFSLKSHQNNNFFDFGNAGLFGILNIVQFVWCLRFLKDAFIFVLSGSAVDWYWRGPTGLEPCLGWSNLILRNWGSVAVGSFFNSIFKIPLLIIELLICHPTGCCHACGNCCLQNCCNTIIDLIRTDAYAYTNLFGKSYCDSCHNCSNLCFEHTQFQGSQSPLRNYRISATLAFSLLGFIAGYAIMNQRVVNINIWFMVELAVLVWTVVWYFTSANASVAEGLQICFMVENQFVGGYDKIRHCDEEIRKGMQEITQRHRRDGGC